MSNVQCVISCPIDIYAGYGGRARDIVKELIREYPDWNIEILSQRWGSCRAGYLEDHKEYDLLNRLVNEVHNRPDVWIQITVPNEFKAVGTISIGITAAMETTLCDSSWVEGCNRMDLVIVSSEHSKFSLQNSKYVDSRTGKNFEVTTPIEILFEGVDKDTYKTLPASERTPILAEVKNSWNYLCIGHWMPGTFGQDRKNIGYTVKVFLETFKDRSGQVPGLILKTSRAISSHIDKREILDRLYTIRESVSFTHSLPNIYLLHGDLTDEEINQVYNSPKVKAMVSFTKGEGYGRPLAEFAAVGKPIICSGWSGPVDFLNREYTAFVGGSITKVHPSAVTEHMILPDASWFTPDDKIAQYALLDVFSDYNKWSKKAELQKKIINTTFSKEKMGEKLKDILDSYLPDFPEKVEMSLPEIEDIVDHGQEE